MAPSKTSIAKWKALSKQGVKWGTVAKSNALELKPIQDQINAIWKTVGGPSSETPLSPANQGLLIKLNKQAAAIKAGQPHKAPSKFSQVASSIAHTVIPAVAVGAVGAGLAGAASSALGGAPAGTAGTVGTGAIGTGASSGNAGFGGVQQLLGGQDGPMGIFDSISGTLDDVGDALSKGSGIYDKVSGLFGKHEHTGSKSLGGSDEAGDIDMGYRANAPAPGGGMSVGTIALLAGAAVLGFLLIRK